MFSYANIFIDSIQTAKSNALKTIVTDSKSREPLQAFIDAQTTFAKEVNRIADTIYSQVTEQVEKFTGKKV
jgi:uncharacterized protein YueI